MKRSTHHDIESKNKKKHLQKARGTRIFSTCVGYIFQNAWCDIYSTVFWVLFSRIQKMLRSGLVDRWYDYHSRRANLTNGVTSGVEARAKPLMLKEAFLAFTCLLCGGLLLASIALTGELIIHKCCLRGNTNKEHVKRNDKKWSTKRYIKWKCVVAVSKARWKLVILAPGQICYNTTVDAVL